MDEASKAARMNERDRLISEDEGLLGTIEKNEANWCSRVQTHIDMMYKLEGEHLNDIPRYIHLLQRENCPKWQEKKEYAEQMGYLPPEKPEYLTHLEKMKQLQTDFYLKKMKQLQSRGLQAAGAHRKSKKSKKSRKTKSRKTKSRRH